MARKFLSFLGTNNYKECAYKFRDIEENYSTKYIQEAILKLICKDWTKEDKAVVFITKEAERLNWYNEEDENSRLKEILEKLNINIKGVSIPEGKTEGEIWEIFRIVINEIDEGDEIVFDITHGFRSIPMLALVILNYAKVTKNASILGVYYGAYDQKDDNGVAPIFDLTPLDEMLTWSQAVNVFLEYGISGPLKDISIRQLRPHLISEQWARDTRQFIDSINNLTMCLYTCRGKVVSGKGSNKKSISSAVELAHENFKQMKNMDEDNQLKPLIPLMDRIEKKLEIFDGNDNLSVGIGAVQWAIEHSLIQQACTALDETIKTYTCEKFGLDSSDRNNRENIVNTALKIRGQDKPEQEWNVEKKYWNQVKHIVEELDDELISISSGVSDTRNDINHFGFRDNASNYEKLEEKVKKYFEKFLDYINGN